MRRLGFLLVMLAACGASHQSGPAWPKSADYVPDYTSEDEQWKEDGGESIDPHESKDTPVEDSEDAAADLADFSSYDFTPDETVIIDSAPPPSSDSPGESPTDDPPPPPPPLGTP